MKEFQHHLKEKYKEVFEIDPEWLIEITAARGKWIDQSQSHNVFMKGVSGKKLNDIYITAWKLDLKTTYYLRTLVHLRLKNQRLMQRNMGLRKSVNMDQRDTKHAMLQLISK